MTIKSGFCNAIEALGGGDVPVWAYTYDRRSTCTRLVDYEGLRCRFGPMTYEQAQAVRQEIRKRLVEQYAATLEDAG